MICTGNPNLVMALAGNKADLDPKRKIEAEVCKILSVTFLSPSQMHVVQTCLNLGRMVEVALSEYVY